MNANQRKLQNEKVLNSLIDNKIPTRKDFNNLSGNTYGKLYVNEIIGHDNYNRVIYKCICKCGNIVYTSGYLLKNNLIKSCGCEENNISHLKHGDSKRGNKSHLYMIWCDMKYRCTSPKNHKYYRYGGRGIKICDEWLDKEHGYENFKLWALENGYKDNCGLSIDRIDVDGDYCPENCRWADNKMQQNNKRNTIYIRYKKWVYPLYIWSEITGLPPKLMHSRKDKGWTDEEILTYAYDNVNHKKVKSQSINYYLAEEFHEYNKYNEFIKKGIIKPEKELDYSKLEIKVNPKFNLRFI